MTAGQRRHLVAFDEIAEADSSFGTMAGEYEEMFQRYARMKYLIGSEPVLAQRLTGVQPTVITVLSDTDTRTVTTAWRIRDVASGKAFNIRAVTPDEKRKDIDFLVEAGVATNA